MLHLNIMDASTCLLLWLVWKSYDLAYVQLSVKLCKLVWYKTCACIWKYLFLVVQTVNTNFAALTKSTAEKLSALFNNGELP